MKQVPGKEKFIRGLRVNQAMMDKTLACHKEVQRNLGREKRNKKEDSSYGNK